MPHIRYYAALADIGGLVARSPELSDLLQEACELVVRHTGSTSTYIATIERDEAKTTRLAAVAGPASPYIRNLPLSVDPDHPGGNGSVGHAYRTGGPIVSNDCLHDSRIAHMRQALKQWNVLSAAGVPIFIDSECRGVLVVAAGQTDHYDSDLIGMLERMAEVIAVGIDRAEQRIHRSRYETLYRIQSEINALIVRSPQPHELFEESCRIVAKTSDRLYADILLADASGEYLEMVACAGQVVHDDMGRAKLASRLSTRADDPDGQGIAGTTYRARQTVIWLDVPQSAETETRSMVRQETNTRSLMGVPVFVSGECRAILVLGSSEPDYFDNSLIAVSEQIAASLGLALESCEQRESLRTMALSDALTGLPNRTLFADRLHTEMARADRRKGRFAVALVDVGNLKEINARLGHSAGDDALCQAAVRIGSCLRKSDTAARLGGDQFALILPVRKSASRIDGILSRILTTIGEPLVLNGHHASLRASIGVCIYPDDAQVEEDLLRRAELALTRIKRTGGNVWGAFEQPLEHALWRRHRVKERFSRALENGEIVFHYQPIVELPSGKVVAAEALVRWDDPRLGLVPPGEWIGVVEDDPRMIVELGRHALTCAIGQLHAWHARGKVLSLSVNIGVRHLLSAEFLEDLQGALAVAPELAPYLVLEVTETALIEDFEAVARALAECRRLGVRIALDDFGTGQASLTYLLELPADRIKIDHSFVIRMLSEFRAFGIVIAAAQGTRLLGMDSVAEGVETEEHGLRLLQVGCRYAQGFGIARPMSNEAFDRWLLEWKAPRSWMESRASPLTQKETQLLASLVLHRSRYSVISTSQGQSDLIRHAFSPEVWSSYCPADPEVRAAGGGLHHDQLLDLHRNLHRFEQLCISQLGDSGAVSERLLTTTSGALKQYEEHVNSLLARHGQNRDTENR